MSHPPMNPEDINCPACYDRVELLLERVHLDLESVLAHHGLKAEVRIVADETLAEQTIWHFGRLVQDQVKRLFGKAVA